MSPREQQALDVLREHIEAGLDLSMTALGRRLGVSRQRASAIVEDLRRDGLIERSPRRARAFRLPGQVNLRGVSSRMLLAELARRGETIDTLAGDTALSLAPDAQHCAHDGCGVAIGRGKLFCRRHWFQLPLDVRERLLRAFADRDEADYAEVFSEAKLRLEGAWRDA